MAQRGMTTTKTAVVKTTVALPEALWKQARIRAIEEHADLQDIVSKALTLYLRTKPEAGR